jgi:prepilin-type processing-associated H-X9-DG protein
VERLLRQRLDRHPRAEHVRGRLFLGTSPLRWVDFRGAESRKVVYGDTRHDLDTWAEGDWYYHGELGRGEPADGNVAWWYQMWPLYTHFEAATRHRGGGMYAFGDGHCEWIRREDFWTTANHNWKLFYLLTPNWIREDLF